MFIVTDFMDKHERALAERRAEYASLSAALAEWSEARAELGVFTILAQATVRPTRGGR